MKKIMTLLAFICSVSFAQEIGARYLIITHDNFYSYIQPLAQWKHRKGMRTKVVKTSEIGSTAPDIRNYIVNAYNTWTIRPEYLLLVGAPNFIPFGQMDVSTDNYYTDINNDILNDILSGRLTVHDANEAQTVVNKILLYERTPDMSDSTWFIDACLIVREDYDNYDDSIYWSDINHAKNLMQASGYQTIDTLSLINGNNASSIISSVNQGRAFVLYRGQGVGNWWTPFDVNPDGTANGARLPIVLSITCSTIGSSSNPATAERWLLTGTPTSPRGGAGYFATTTTLSGGAQLRSATCKGFFNALFDQRKSTFGQACEGGRRNVYNLYGSTSEYRGFTTLGDPEMNIWTARPKLIMVSHPPIIPIGNANFAVNVAYAQDTTPVDSATVCIVGAQDTMIYALAVTNTNGNAFFSLYPQFIEDTLYVTVTGKNLRPYEGHILTTSTACYVTYLKSEINDSLGGNNDGIINPSEEINLPLWVRNYGDSTAYGVTGLLRVDDPNVTLTDSIKTFGNIAGGDSAFTGDSGYFIAIAPNVPDNHVVNFSLICQDANDSTWTSQFSEEIHRATLHLDTVMISGGNGNNSFEAAETVAVVLTLSNTGSVAIENVTAELRSLSSYVSVLDSNGTFTHIGPDSSASNSTDPFVVCSDSSTPYGTEATFKMTLNAGYYVDSLEFILRIGLFLPTDTGYYYAYYSNSGHVQSPIFTWVAIDSTQTLIPGISLNLANDQTLVFSLPFIFPYYGLAYDHISICSNGWITLGGQTSIDPSNSPIPGTDGPSAMIAGLWDDLDPGNTGQPSDVYYYYDTAQHRFIVEYFRVEHWPGGDHETFEIILCDPAFYPTPTGDGEIIVQYLTAMQQTDNTIGIENSSQTIGIQYFLNDAYNSLAAPVTDSFALKYTTYPPTYVQIYEHKEPQLVPRETRMGIVQPNPFADKTTVHYYVSTRSDVSLRIHDVTGRTVRTFAHGIAEPGHYDYHWDAVDDMGCRVPAGIYFITFYADPLDRTGTYRHAEKTVLLK